MTAKQAMEQRAQERKLLSTPNRLRQWNLCCEKRVEPGVMEKAITYWKRRSQRGKGNFSRKKKKIEPSIGEQKSGEFSPTISLCKRLREWRHSPHKQSFAHGVRRGDRELETSLFLCERKLVLAIVAVGASNKEVMYLRL